MTIPFVSPHLLPRMLARPPRTLPPLLLLLFLHLHSIIQTPLPTSRTLWGMLWRMSPHVVFVARLSHAHTHWSAMLSYTHANALMSVATATEATPSQVTCTDTCAKLMETSYQRNAAKWTLSHFWHQNHHTANMYLYICIFAQNLNF